MPRICLLLHFVVAALFSLRCCSKHLLFGNRIRGPEFRGVGDVAIGQEHHRRHVPQRYPHSLDGGVETIAGGTRGKDRHCNVELVQYASPTDMVFESTSGGLITLTEIELVALSPNRTRISVQFDIKPRTLPARLFVQSMKLAKSNLTKRFKLRVADYARDIEDRCHRLA